MNSARRIITLLLALFAASHAAERPNILWITSKDNAAHWLGCYGNAEASTPHASWVNPVECFFSILTPAGLQQQVHKSGKALERFLKSFVETCNRERGPFTWSKGPGNLNKIIKLTKAAHPMT